jgi:hypothetical protein
LLVEDTGKNNGEETGKDSALMAADPHPPPPAEGSEESEREDRF